MNPKEAEAFVKTLDTLLTGCEFVSVNVHPYDHYRPTIRLHETYRSAYVVTHKDGSAVVGVCDSYGVITGVESFSIDDRGMRINMYWTNAYGERIQQAYVITSPVNDAMRQAWHEAMERSWKDRES